METMRKIPQDISVYIDASIDRALDRGLNEQRAIFNREMDIRFFELLTDIDARFLDFQLRFNSDMKRTVRGVLDEFDSRLKTIGEYVDTKPDRKEVQNMIDDEFHSRNL